MRSYGIKFIAVTVIIVIALSFLFRPSSDDTEKYAGGTLIKAGEESIYAFSTDCEASGYEGEESKKSAVHAYAKSPEAVAGTVKNVYDSGVEAFIDNNSDNLVYVRKPKV